MLPKSQVTSIYIYVTWLVCSYLQIIFTSNLYKLYAQVICTSNIYKLYLQVISTSRVIEMLHSSQITYVFLSTNYVIYTLRGS